jgi:transmembrane sensor
MESSEQIERRAATWLQKRDSGTWSGADQSQLDEWLRSSTAHRVAFLRLEAGWDEVNRLKALAAGLPRGKVPPVGAFDRGFDSARVDELPASLASRSGSPSRPFARPLALAASLVALCVGGYYFARTTLASDQYQTPIGGVSSISLQDGSKVTLNTASRIRVRLTQDERRVDLAAGEAFFDVAKDTARRFVVSAGSKRVIAVGTQFSVRRDDDTLRVVVTEGVVHLEDVDTRPPASGDAAAPVSTDLAAGVVALTTGADTILKPASMQVAQELLSWRSGYLVFRDVTLADAIAEFNRYNERRIVIRDPEIADIHLSGRFRTHNFEAFARLLVQSFPIRAEFLPDRIELAGTGLAASEQEFQ